MDILNAGLSFAYNPGLRTADRELIVHHAAGNGSVEAVHRQHLQNGWCGIAYHYYVRKDGSVWYGRPEAWKGGHTLNHSQALGVCFEGNFETEAMGAAQRLAGRALVADIAARYPGIAIRRHREVNATACPGGHFPFEEILEDDMTYDQFKDYLAQYEAETVYRTAEDLPEWGRSTVEKLMAMGLIEGYEGELNISYDLLRVLVVNDRAGLYEGEKGRTET